MTRRWLLPSALACLLLLPSCFTFGVWGFELESERDPRSGRVESTMAYMTPRPSGLGSCSLFVCS